MTFGVSSIIFAFFYNSWHLNWMIKNGYRLPGTMAGIAGIANSAGAVSHNVINVTVAAPVSAAPSALSDPSPAAT
jgi:hypothetical protein